MMLPIASSQLAATGLSAFEAGAALQTARVVSAAITTRVIRIPRMAALQQRARIHTAPRRTFTLTRSSAPASARLPNLPSPLLTSPIANIRRISTTPVSWTPPTPEEAEKRPVLIIGAGNLGRRMATIWASTGRPVVLHDISEPALLSAVEYIGDQLTDWCVEQGTHPGHVTTVSGDLAAALSASATNLHLRPWMAVEAVPEDLALKRKILGEVERLVPDDCLLASNSSSYRTAEMVGEGGVASPHRLLSTYYYYMSPYHRFVELMSSGATAPEVFPFLEAQMAGVQLRPIVLPPHVQYNGFVFNRIWEAIRGETLRVVTEGHVKPEDIDELFKDFFRAEVGPCGKMGLDVTGKSKPVGDRGF
ncbi:uncharacterized protein E0L32_002840 [Thyridium curvatum]|uniref:3-hydroxyacyl-CoA dehydrogenase NAD binding domain-containing protein n=1 Tax=Thyridium curvatum TaxID=1093900 RepID=A0A507BK04_9PEZI|nr:uncharacterized protein E0L32_002840 [Thyridium curvatum]TPX17739.1 hypothetical protein E0L32_002840 [Thyridium curvatum]